MEGRGFIALEVPTSAPLNPTSLSEHSFHSLVLTGFVFLLDRPSMRSK